MSARNPDNADNGAYLLYHGSRHRMYYLICHQYHGFLIFSVSVNSQPAKTDVFFIFSLIATWEGSEERWKNDIQAFLGWIGAFCTFCSAVLSRHYLSRTLGHPNSANCLSWLRSMCIVIMCVVISVMLYFRFFIKCHAKWVRQGTRRLKLALKSLKCLFFCSYFCSSYFLLFLLINLEFSTHATSP